MPKDPHGNVNGRHRRWRERRRWKYEYVSFTADDVKPMDILLTREKSFISAIIIYFSGTSGKKAFVSHCGQVMADGVTVSEANFPEQEQTDIQEYFNRQKKGEVKLTLVRFVNDIVFPTEEIRQEAYQKCQEYHQSIKGDRYDVVALLPMMLIALLRGVLPFLKRGKWFSIPQKAERVITICSRIIDKGWGWLQRKTHRDLFPSSLSLRVVSPQDIYDSYSTKFIAGWKMVRKNQRR